MADQNEGVGVYIDRLRNNLKEESLRIRLLVVGLISCPGIDSDLRLNIADAVNRIMSINAMNLEDIDNIETHLPIGLLYKVHNEEDTGEDDDE